MNKNYHTKQKEIILDKIKSIKHEFTIKELYEYINHEVGMTTIYRLIDKMVSDGKLIKNIKNDNITYYTYLCECKCNNHFYLKCQKCDKYIHISCDCINELADHIRSEHKFMLTDKIIINGICKDCMKEVGNNG